VSYRRATVLEDTRINTPKRPKNNISFKPALQ
jgi:hypothetical protein